MESRRTKDALLARDYHHEMESGDEMSLETTVPTDLSLSVDDDVLSPVDRRKKMSKQLYERKQLLHDIQLLKIELSQKGLLLDNMKAEHMQRVDELEEKLSDALHEKQLLQARLESQMKIQQDDAKRRTELVQKELETILKRQQQLESTNERLQEKAVDIRKDLKDLEVTENQYQDLRLKEVEELSLKDCVGMKMFEAVKPWKLETAELRSRCKGMSEELHVCRAAFEKCQDELDNLSRHNSELEKKHQRLTINYTDLKAQVQHGDYKIENFDKIKRDRDDFDAELVELKKQQAYLEASYQTAAKDRDDLNIELMSAKQTISLLEKDKDFFSKQVSELHNKLLYNEDKVIQLGEQLERAKASREELYDKYVASRDQYKMEYESKLRDELELIRVRTNSEIDRLKQSTKEMYERENRGLREARDMALTEKDRCVATERDSNSKYDHLLQEYRQQQVNHDGKLSELQNEVKLKAFEAERTHLVYEETVRNLKECQLENEKLQKKLEVLTKEYYSLQMTSEKRLSELESDVGEKRSRLETYENLEKELDEVVMQAADVEEETEAEKVLFSYGYGANVPTTSKRRLKQSVHLARRVLQLERENTTLRKDVEREVSRNKELADQVKNANVILDQSQQPYHYLVESVRLRDSQIAKQKDHIQTLEADVKRLEKQRIEMSKAKNQMATDLERLLNQKEEMSVMKQVVLNMSRRRGQDPTRVPRAGPASSHGPVISKPKALSTPRTPKGSGRSSARSSNNNPSAAAVTGSKRTAVHQKHAGVTFEPPERDENVHKPPPTEFTVSNPPDWYSRLKEKNTTERKEFSKLYAGKV